MFFFWIYFRRQLLPCPGVCSCWPHIRKFKKRLERKFRRSYRAMLRSLSITLKNLNIVAGLLKKHSGKYQWFWFLCRLFHLTSKGMSNTIPGCHPANAWRSRSKHILQWRYRNEVSVQSINPRHCPGDTNSLLPRRISGESQLVWVYTASLVELK